MKRSFSVKRLLVAALGAFVLAWFAGPAAAQQGGKQLPAQEGSGAKAAPAHKGAAPIHVSGPGCQGCGVPEHAWGGGCPGGGAYGGVGFYFVQPFWENNPALTFTRTVGTTTTTSRHDFDYDYEFVPRVYLGFENEGGLGARVSWYRYQQGTSFAAVNTSQPAGTTVTIAGPFNVVNSVSTALAAGDQDLISVTNGVIVDVWDFDITQRIIDNECWDVVLGGGIRYAHLSQEYGGYQARSIGGAAANLIAAISNSVNFNGAGPDIFIEGRRYLGDGALALYANLRTGILFGTTHRPRFAQTVAGNQVNFTNTDIRNDDLLPFIDGEIGIEWAGEGNGSFQPVIRLGIVGQSWFGAGSATTANANENLGFFGLSVLAGANF